MLKQQGKIEIKVSGTVAGMSIAPDYYDIKEIKKLLELVEPLLYPGGKTNRPLISYEIESGSVRHILTTSMQAVIAFDAILAQVQAQRSVSFLETQSAKAILAFHDWAKTTGYTFDFTTSISSGVQLSISNNSVFEKSEDIWIETELYLYGVLEDAGGASQANIHMRTKEYGSVTISADKSMLRDLEENILYKEYGARVSGRQNVQTLEIDTKSLSLIQLIDYRPMSDDVYLSALIQSAQKSWAGVKDVDAWLNDLRGNEQP